MTTTTCSHHWLIEEPNGEFSKGRCKKCNETRQFQNSLTRNSGWYKTIKESKVGKGHGMTKDQLINLLKSEGKTLPDNPRIYKKGN